MVAYYLLGTEEFRDECGRFWRAANHVTAPASWEAEVTNVLWMAVRKQVLTLPEAVGKLDLALSLGIHSVPVAQLWQGALARACTTSIAAYDTLFVELAVREQLPMVTFDQVVLRAFPAIACLPAGLLA